MRLVDTRVKIMPVPCQEAMSVDSVEVKVDAVLYYKITDPLKAINEVESYKRAVLYGAERSLVKVVGRHTLDDMLWHRDALDSDMKTLLNGMFKKWGITVIEVETKNVEFSESVRRAVLMESSYSKRACLVRA
jgi:regulator of protease activity HflC (stomatin/prohibitin superfamily)